MHICDSCTNCDSNASVPVLKDSKRIGLLLSRVLVLLLISNLDLLSLKCTYVY